MSERRERYLVTLEAMPDEGTPAVVRLRRLLKKALRLFGFRCLHYVETPPEPAQEKAPRAVSLPPAGRPGPTPPS